MKVFSQINTNSPFELFENNQDVEQSEITEKKIKLMKILLNHRDNDAIVSQYKITLAERSFKIRPNKKKFVKGNI